MEPTDLLRTISRILDQLKIPYLITGGLAVSVWGHPRFTADIDLVIELVPEKIDRLADELLKIGKAVYVDRDMIQAALKQRGEFNFLHPDSGLKVDFWMLKDDAFDQARLRRRISRKVTGTLLDFSSAEDLILIKLLWYKEGQSTRQLEDIRSILAVQRDLDIGYIEQWAKRQTTFEIWRSLQKNSMKET